MNPKRAALTAMLASIAALLVPAAGAETLYKLIDRNGKVTYSESPPKDFDGKVIRMDIDPKANTAVAPKRPPAEATATSKAAPAGSVASRGSSIELAREKLQKARAAYEDARDNPKDEDYRNVGAGGGGMHGMGARGPSRILTDDYQLRLAGLENVMKQAEEELRSLENGK
jgi:hypothetical protein